MKPIIVDASVAIKWFVPEVHAKAAVRVLDEKFKLLAPDLIFAEFGNILWKKCRLKELTLPIAKAILDDFKRVPLVLRTNENLLNEAWQIATQYNCTVYDSLYVAMAKIEQGILITADKALYQNLKTSELSSHLLWVEDIESYI